MLKEGPNEVVGKCLHLDVGLVLEDLASGSTEASYFLPAPVAVIKQVLLEGLFLHVAPTTLDILVDQLTPPN
jgi:hypothetical protein